MRTMQFEIKERMPGLNDYIKAERIHRQAGAAMKKKWTDLVAWQLKGMRLLDGTRPAQFEHPVLINLTWIEPNNKRDPDNIIFAKKFILDGMTVARLLKNDNQACIKGFSEGWVVDPTSKGGVMVTIREVDYA